MIAGIFKKGMGLGNMLHQYVMARVLSLDKGVDFGMIFPENFKGDFFNLDMGVKVENLLYEYTEKKDYKDKNDISDYDWDGILNIKDFTLVEGCFQGEKYYKHHLDKIREWLKVDEVKMSEDVCVINFRGGEYVGVKDLFLPQEYWDRAISLMKDKYPTIRFEVHTDDPITASEFFPDFPIYSGIETNWRAVRFAKHLIISNSSFAILPSLLGEAHEIIAPSNWAGYNKGYWQQEQCKFNKFLYI